MKYALALLVSLLWSGLSSAHEGRPVYIKLTQTAPLEYKLQWKTPPVMASGQEPMVHLQASGCERSAGDLRRRLTGTHQYLCQDTAPALAVELQYPKDNPALSTLVVFERLHGEQSQHFSGPEALRITLPTTVAITDVAWQYISAGAEHILIGYDHLLFVLCLLVIAGSTRRLLLTITGFTLAHSLTLALASFQILRLPIPFVEILIALSIVILAAEIIKNKRHTLAWRYPVATATAFGLLHGLGFASVLGELGLPQQMKLTALVFFNIGIEAGQVIFILACLLLKVLLVMLRKAPLLQLPQRVQQHSTALPTLGIYLVGVTSAYWLAERSFGLYF